MTNKQKIMAADITYRKTYRGERAFIKKLPDAVGQILMAMTEDSTEEDILAKLTTVSRRDFKTAMTWLLEGGFIKLTDPTPIDPEPITQPSTDAIQVHEISIDEFNRSNQAKKQSLNVAIHLPKQTASVSPQPTDKPVKRSARQQEAENKERLAAIAKSLEEAKIKRAEQEAAKERSEANKEQERLKAIEAAKQAAEAKAKETARLKAEAEAKAKAEIQAKKEEWARLKAMQEAREKAEIQAKKEERTRLRAEIIAKERAKIRAKKEEEARLKAEKEAKEKAIADAEAKRKADLLAMENEKRRAEENAKAQSWLQLKMAAKEKAQEKARQKRLAKAEAEIQRKNNAKHARFRGGIKKGLSALFSALKSLFIFILAIFALLLLAAHFINIPILINPLEKIISEHLQETINIKSAHIWVYPKPHLLLKDVSIQDADTLAAQKIRIYPSYSNLKEKFYDRLSVPYLIPSINVEGLSVTQQNFTHLNTWVDAASAHKQYQINKITFKNSGLILNKLQLPLFDGEISLNAEGLLTKAKLQTAQKNLSLSAQSYNKGYLIDIAASNWRAPFYPHPVFAQLDASGTIKNELLTLASITGELYEGKVEGSLKTNLASPTLATEGDFNITDLIIERMPADIALNKILTGELSSRGYFSFNTDETFSTITKTKVNAPFTVNRGVLKKIDIAEAMRNRNLNGFTNFSELKGHFSLNNQRYQLSNLVLQDSQLFASGTASMSNDQQVSASLTARIAIPNNEINANLMIKGPLTSLNLIN